MPSLTPYDERFVHQIPEPLSVVGIEHEHWRESYFFAAHGRDAGSDVLIVAMATYPARKTLDALILGRIGGELLFHYHQRNADGDPQTTSVGPVTVEVAAPFEELHIAVAPENGVQGELTFRARTQPYALRRGRMLADDGSLLWDQSHMIQSGTFDGRFQRGGTTVDVDSWLGQRDHSWGVRDHARIPLWMWLAVQLPDGMLGVWHWELANGARVFTDGCWAPADGGPPVPVVDFHHRLHWTDEEGEAVRWVGGGEEVAGLAGDVTFVLAGGRRIELLGAGRWCAPYRPFYGGGQHLMTVTTDDGRTGTAIYEVTGRDHHCFFPSTG